jgi:hypothetical protein
MFTSQLRFDGFFYLIIGHKKSEVKPRFFNIIYEEYIIP